MDAQQLLSDPKPAMVGRARPLAELDGLLAAAMSGRGRAAVVLGEPGMGKTTLAEALADHAQDAGTPVVWGWCSAADTPPFWPWMTILRRLTPHHRLAADHAAESDAAGLLRGDAGARAALFVSVVDTLREVCAARPVVLVVEDLQWADGASLQLFRAVVDALPGLPVLLVATCRDESLETGDEVLGVVRDLPTAVERIRLEGLDRDEVGELVTRVLGRVASADVATTVHARTGGNPFFVREVSRLVAARGTTAITALPDGVREVLARRIARVGQDCQRVLEVAAVAGEGSEVFDIADAAAGALMRHWSAALGEEATERAAEWALRAARTARARMGYEQAVDAYRIALQGTQIERTRVMLELGEAQTYAGDLDGARRTFAETAELARQAGRASHLAMAALGMGTGLGGFEVPRHDLLQVRLLEDALALLPERYAALRAAVTGRLSLAYAASDRESQRVDLARAAVDLAGRARDPCVEAGVLAAYCDAVAGPDHVEERVTAASRMLRVAEAGKDVPCQLLARRLRLMAAMERGDWPAVDAEIEAFARTAARLSLPLYEWYVPLWRGARALMSGDVAAALRYAGQAEQIGSRAGSQNARFLVFSLRWWASWSRGVAPVEFTADLREMAELDHDSAAALALSAAHFAAVGEPGPAVAALDRLLGRGLDTVPRDCEWLELLWNLGDAAIALGRRDVAGAVSARLEPHRELWAIDGIGGAVVGVVAEMAGRLAGWPASSDGRTRPASCSAARSRCTGTAARRCCESVPGRRWVD